jgi:DNA repair protein RecN (Recombination protein N)
MSLGRIHLRDFVIVRELEIEFQSGFTVLTGETGAGKSILIDALQFAFGARADAGMIREQANKAEVSVTFSTQPQLVDWLQSQGFESEDEWLIKRILDGPGKSRAWLNASPISTAQLKAIGEQLLDIHGQHAWQSLTRAEEVRALLDAYAGVDSAPLKKAWLDYKEAQHTLEQALFLQTNRTQERERLLWQIAELEKLSPAPLEWEELNAQHQRLSNAQSLLDAAQFALSALQAEDSGALVQLSHALRHLQDLAHVEPQFAEISEVLSSSLAQAQDSAHSVQAWLKSVDLDPHQLQALDDRLSLWLSLSRRFKIPAEELANHGQTWKQELSKLEESLDVELLQNQVQEALNAFSSAAKVVSKARHVAAPKLAHSITQAMQGLGMPGGAFEVSLQPSSQPSAHGLEDVQFLVSAHPGSTPKPVNKVASGGELSRIALAIAVTTSELGSTQTLIFDEVDSGIGGAVAHTVGSLLKQLGQDRQVLAITHLAQVASSADHHWVVSKHRSALGSQSEVTPVVGADRESEIARMLGGESQSQVSMAHAKEMLQSKKTEPKAATPPSATTAKTQRAKATKK